LVEQGQTPQQAADHLIHRDLPALQGGEGGVIVIAPIGDPIWSSNTLGMFRAKEEEGSEPDVQVK
jgi:beta-aspartyl-peptidase (threonine type)